MSNSILLKCICLLSRSYILYYVVFQISRKHKHGNFTITSRAAPIDFNNYYEIGHKGITGIGGKANSQGKYNKNNKVISSFSGSWVDDIYNEENMEDLVNNNNPKSTDIETLMLKLWASATIRDNIVTVFGYLNNKPTEKFTTELYTSLHWIFSAVKLRRIQTVELLPVLKTMVFEKPHSQYLIFFKALENVVPKYLKCSVTIWIEALERHVIDITNIVRPGGGTLIVDLLADIDVRILDKIKENIYFQSTTLQKISKNTVTVMGKFLACVFSSILDKSLKMTQSLVAVIMLHMPVEKFKPEVEEAQRYLVDVLRDNNVESWDIIVQKVDFDINLDPYELIKQVLVGIVELSNNKQVKDSAADIIPHFNAPSIWSIYVHRIIMGPIVGQPKLNALLLLKYISQGEFPTDIVSAKDIIVQAIKTKILDINIILKGFIRFDYSKPADLLIAITNRIRRRYVDLDVRTMRAVKALNAFLVFQEKTSIWLPYVPSGVYDIITMLESIGSPVLQSSILNAQNKLYESLPQEKIDWMTSLQDIQLKGCTRPRFCLVQILNILLSKGTLNNTISKQFSIDLLNLLTVDGEPKNSISKGKLCENALASTPNVTVDSFSSQTIQTTPSFHYPKVSYNFSPYIAKAPESNIPHLIIPPFDTNMEKITQLSTSVSSTVSPSTATGMKLDKVPFTTTEQISKTISEIINHEAMGITSFPMGNLSVKEVFSHYFDTLSIPKNLSDSIEDPKSPIYSFLAHLNLSSELESKINVKNYSSRRSVLVDILKEALNTTRVQNDFKLYEAIHQLLEKIEEALKSKSEEEEDYQRLLEEKAAGVPEYPSLVSTIPEIDENEGKKHRTVLIKFLKQKNLPAILGPEFQPINYQTKGTMLQAVLKYALTLKHIKSNKNIEDAITYFKDKIIVDGIGSQPVLWITHMTRTIDFNLMFKSVEEDKLSPEEIDALERIYDFFVEEFKIEKHLKGFNFFVYSMQGEFMAAIMKHLIKQKYIDPNLKHDIKAILPHILLSGNGALPLEAVETSSLNGSLDMSTLPLQLQVQERTTDDVKQLFSQSEYAYLLALIPEDKDDSNYKKRSLILNFLNQNNLYELLGQEFKISESHNKGLVLQTLFKHALTLNKVTSNESLSEALNFYMDKINMNGRGGHPLVWVKHNTKTIDLNSLLNVVDVSKLNKNELVNFDKVYEFFMNKLNMDEQLKGFDFNKHRSQEQLLKDVATHLLKQDNVEDKIRKYIEELILHLPVPRVNVEDN